ncbi:MAG TPA: hypothetical protein VIK65_13980 [Candidatus Limnocylindrales bacterium]|jgi:hypothetical protein
MSATRELRPRVTPASRAAIGPSRRRSIERRLRGAYAEDQISGALYRVIVNAVALGPCNGPSERDRDWLRAAVRAPLRSSTEAALETLSRDLARIFDRAPADLRRWLDAAEPGPGPSADGGPWLRRGGG